MLNAQDSTTLGVIFQAASSGEDWPGMLRALTEYLHADSVFLFTSQAAWDNAGPIADPAPAMLTGLRPGRVYTGEELRDRALSHSRFDNCADLRALGLRSATGTDWILAMRLRGDFRAVDSAALAMLTPILGQALAFAQTLRANIERADHAETLLRRLGIGRLEFDTSGRCTAQDATAHDLLTRAGLTPQQLPLRDTGLHQIAPGLELMPLPPTNNRQEVLVRGTDLPLPEPAKIAQALGLSQPEARLARALGEGARLSEAAQALGITVETARFYSKQIFAKTGLRGQPDLMRRLWSGLLALR